MGLAAVPHAPYQCVVSRAALTPLLCFSVTSFDLARVFAQGHEDACATLASVVPADEAAPVLAEAAAQIQLARAYCDAVQRYMPEVVHKLNTNMAIARLLRRMADDADALARTCELDERDHAFVERVISRCISFVGRRAPALTRTRAYRERKKVGGRYR